VEREGDRKRAVARDRLVLEAAHAHRQDRAARVRALMDDRHGLIVPGFTVL